MNIDQIIAEIPSLSLDDARRLFDAAGNHIGILPDSPKRYSVTITGLLTYELNTAQRLTLRRFLTTEFGLETAEAADMMSDLITDPKYFRRNHIIGDHLSSDAADELKSRFNAAGIEVELEDHFQYSKYGPAWG